MSIRELSLKELRALAQQRLGAKAAELKTRQELVDALEPTEPKKVPKLIVPLSSPLPEPRPPVVKDLPPEPVIWTGNMPLPQITALPSVKEFPTERLVWTAQVMVPAAPAVEVAEVAAPLPEFSSEEGVPQFTVPEEAKPKVVTEHFFVEPQQPRLPVTYQDDRVLTFARDPKSLYVAWDFAPATFAQGRAEGRVVDDAGATVQSFAVIGPAGGMFVEGLEAAGRVKVEIRRVSLDSSRDERGASLIGESSFVTMPSPSKTLWPTPVNAPSSVV